MYFLHSVIIHKPITLKEARKIRKHFIKPELLNEYILRNDNLSYRFSLNKYLFKKESFRTKVINPHISLVYADLK
jgi:hypothetical protein